MEKLRKLKLSSVENLTDDELKFILGGNGSGLNPSMCRNKSCTRGSDCSSNTCASTVCDGVTVSRCL